MPALHTFKIIALVGCGYWLAGTLSGYLAIPPGFSSPVWPAAGLALLSVLHYGWPAMLGVALGSFNVNLAISGQSLAQPSWAWLPAISIAIGASLQARFGAFLVNRVLASRIAWHSSTGYLLLAAVAGPISCLVSASVGTFTLWHSAAIHTADVAINWATWWVGDSIGVIVTVPLLLVLNLASQWTRLEQIRFSLSYVALTCLVIVLFYSARASDDKRIESLFLERAENIHLAIDRHLSALQQHQVVLAESFATFPDITENQFQRLVHRIKSLTAGTQALSWIRPVDASNRAQIDANLRARGATFGISERGDNGKLQPVAQRETYFTVFYISPLAGNRTALGLDIASEPKRRQALTASLHDNQSHATVPLKLVQERGEQIGLLLLTPISTPRDDRPGLISGVYRTGDLFRAALSEFARDDIAIKIVDVSSPNAKSLVYSNGLPPSYLSENISLAFGNRDWQLRLAATGDYLRKQRGWSAWGVLTGGFLLTSIVGALFLLQMSQNNIIAREVAEKTIALNDALDTSEKASQAKSQFLANMSHELRTPLNSIIGFTRRLLRSADTDLNARQRDSLETVLRNGEHLLNLITEILDISKIEAGKMELNLAPTQVQSLLAEAIDSVAQTARDKGLALHLDSDLQLVLTIDRQRILQAVLNLLSNAIKFTDQGSVTLRALIETHDGHQSLSIQVEDTGRGIASEQRNQLFKPFQQLNSANIATPGTGLGLVLSKHMIELHGGSIGVHSELNKGSCFSIYLPIS